VNQLLLH